ncbi:MAG: glycerate kinase [Thermodesulfobacteriota bacterium]
MSANPPKKARLKKDALAIFQAALTAVEPDRAVAGALRKKGQTLEVLQGPKAIKSVNLKKVNHVFVVGAGKATAPMAQAVEKVLGARISRGVISVKQGHGLKLRKIRVREAAHPVPDQTGVDAAEEIKALLADAGPDDLVISLISGGGSALLPLPAPGVKLAEKQAVTRLLLGCGATIHEMNAVRKHLSQVKGGQMARLAAPATVINLMLSDVVGDDMDTIASGPFVPDHSTYDEAMLILAKYKLVKKVSKAVRAHLRQGLTRQIEETPKPGEPYFDHVTNLIVGSNYLALEAAAAKSRKLGYEPLILSSTIEGETREVAKVHAALAREVRATGHPVAAPACLISGGETTVTVKGKGQGGRNQEFALAASIEISGLTDVLIFSAGTDGTDGPTDAAGAMADGGTVLRADQAGLSAHKHLRENNAYPFFQKLGDLVMTGPTRTNVMDVRLVLVR